MKLTDYRTLGKSGLRISAMTLGTMTFGKKWKYGAEPEEANKILLHYIENGGYSIDTTNILKASKWEHVILHELFNKYLLRLKRKQAYLKMLAYTV